MKNLINKLKPFGLLIMVLAMFTSCNEEPITIDTADTSLNGLKVITYGKGKLQKSLSGTTIVKFVDQQAYDYYIEDLEAQVEARDDAFLAQWGYLDEDALNAKEEELGFDAEKPLTDFENMAGLTSLRKAYNLAEANWLNNDVLDEATDPDNDPRFDFDANEMAVINKYSEVQVGTTIYKQLSLKEIDALNDDMMKRSFLKRIDPIDEGATLEIADEDYETLIAYNNGNTSVVEYDNVTITNTEPSVNCVIGKRKVVTKSMGSNRAGKLMIKTRRALSGFSSGKIKSKLVSFKKKSNGKWRRARANISAGAIGKHYNYHCIYRATVNDKESRNNKKKVKFNLAEPNYEYWVENGGLKGIYSLNGVEAELVLSW